MAYEKEMNTAPTLLRSMILLCLRRWNLQCVYVISWLLW